MSLVTERPRQSPFAIAILLEVPLGGCHGPRSDTLRDIRILPQIPFLFNIDSEREAAFEKAVIGKMLRGGWHAAIFDRLANIWVGLQVPRLVNLDGRQYASEQVNQVRVGDADPQLASCGC